MTAPNKWLHDRVSKWHTLNIPNDQNGSYVYAYKTGGGDYAASAGNDIRDIGDDNEYFDTLRQAKKAAESWVADGTWVNYLYEVPA